LIQTYLVSYFYLLIVTTLITVFFSALFVRRITFSPVGKVIIFTIVLIICYRIRQIRNRLQ